MFGLETRYLILGMSPYTEEKILFNAPKSINVSSKRGLSGFKKLCDLYRAYGEMPLQIFKR